MPIDILKVLFEVLSEAHTPTKINSHIIVKKIVTGGPGSQGFKESYKHEKLGVTPESFDTVLFQCQRKSRQQVCLDWRQKNWMKFSSGYNPPFSKFISESISLDILFAQKGSKIAALPHDMTLLCLLSSFKGYQEKAE